MAETDPLTLLIMGSFAAAFVGLLIHRFWLRRRQPRLSKTWAKPRYAKPSARPSRAR